MIFEPLSSQTVRNRTSSFLSLFQYFSFHLEVRELLSLFHSYELVHPCVTLAREDDLPYPTLPIVGCTLIKAALSSPLGLMELPFFIGIFYICPSLPWLSSLRPWLSAWELFKKSGPCLDLNKWCKSKNTLLVQYQLCQWS